MVLRIIKSYQIVSMAKPSNPIRQANERPSPMLLLSICNPLTHWASHKLVFLPWELGQIVPQNL